MKRLRHLFPLLLASCAARFPVSDHSDGSSFYDTPALKISTWKLLKWQFTRKPRAWPDSIAVQATHPAASVDSGIAATWVGHATVLVQAPGLNLLTDPVWSPRIGPWSWVGPKRKAAPGVREEDLPRIDAVLLSHDHYDHADMPTLRRLASRPAIVGIAPLGTADLLRDAGFAKVVELDWWQETVLASGDTVTLVPAHHWTSRWPWSRNHRLWGGFVVSTKSGRIYFAGDTGDGPYFGQIADRLGPMDLALIPIGACEPRWFMASQHIGPVEALAAAKRLKAKTSLAIHWGTFALADDGPREALDTLKSLLAHDTANVDFRTVEIGQSVHVPPNAPNVP
jgi:L-ascorbate metabolism protein UlaG (beta-lactamase superfamily)